MNLQERDAHYVSVEGILDGFGSLVWRLGGA